MHLSQIALHRRESVGTTSTKGTDVRLGVKEPIILSFARSESGVVDKQIDKALEQALRILVRPPVDDYSGYVSSLRPMNDNR